MEHDGNGRLGKSGCLVLEDVVQFALGGPPVAAEQLGSTVLVLAVGLGGEGLKKSAVFPARGRIGDISGSIIDFGQIPGFVS